MSIALNESPPGHVIDPLSIVEALSRVNQTGTDLSVMSQDRLFSLDVLRGFAVMGILMMNIIAFAMPMSAYLNPMAYGAKSSADLTAWVVAFVLVDGKMRGLFSLLFGASTLLVINRAAANGQNPAQVHYRRMIWLFILGLLHGGFIWDGDILALYALCGMAAYLLCALTPKQLISIGSLLIFGNLVLWTFILLTAHDLRQAAVSLGTAPARAAFAEMADALGAPGGPSIMQDLAKHQSGYWALTIDRLRLLPSGMLEFLYGYGLETLGLMAWGMALFKAGTLTGKWPRKRLLICTACAYAVGLPFSLYLAHIAQSSGFDVLMTADIAYLLNTPARLAMMLGHVFLLSALIQSLPHRGLMTRVGDAGRMAFSNYILTSVLMTTLFYGYGFGLYGHVTRIEAYLPVPIMWVAMLIWSPIWLRHFAYGPLEWLWRSLARGSLQKFRLSLG